VHGYLLGEGRSHKNKTTTIATKKPWRRISKLQTDTGSGAAKRGLVAEDETVRGLSEPGAPEFTGRPPGLLRTSLP
jgi:hypothetical protein